jgi:hypothetical protein
MKRSALVGLVLLAGQAAFAAVGPEMILLGKGRPTNGPDASAGFKALAGAMQNVDGRGTVHVDATGQGTLPPVRPEPENDGPSQVPAGMKSIPRP